MHRSRIIEAAFLAASSGLALVFLLAPGVDLWFSGLVLGLLALLVHNLVRRRAAGPFTTRAVLLLLAVLAVGPGLVVNGVFKDHWGRARPRDVVEFGGTKTFTPAFVISDQCERNCSFVSGHASLPFALAALGFVLRRRRRAIYAGAAVFGGLVGFGRILQGAHFLSDVIFSAVFVFAVAYLLAYYVFRLPSGAKPTGSESGS